MLELKIPWTVELIICVFFGEQMVSLFTRKHFNLLERLGTGVPLGLFVFGWGVFLISTGTVIQPIHGVIVSGIQAILGLIAAFFNRGIRYPGTVTLSYFEQWTVILTIFLGLVSCSGAMLMGGQSSTGAACSDLPLHLSLITSEAYGFNSRRKSVYDLWTPFISNEHLAYPLMADFISAAFVGTGNASLRDSLFLSTYLLFLSQIASVYCLAKRLTQDGSIAILSVVIFICLGGNGWTILFDIANGQRPSDFVHNWSDEVHGFWFHPLMHLLMPQRSAMLTMPLCFWTVHLLVIGVDTKDPLVFLLAGVLTGLAPQGQAHGYMALAQYAIGLCLVTLPKKLFLQWFLYGVFGIGLALPQVSTFFGRIEKDPQNFLKFNPVWNMQPPQYDRFAPLVLWWRGLGPFWLIAMIGGFITASKRLIVFYVPAVFVFIISNVLRYQLWEMDNIKVMYDGWIPIAVPFVAQFIYSFYTHASKSRLASPTFVILLIVTILSGALCCFVSVGSSGQVFDEIDIKFGKWLSENTPQKAIFLAPREINISVSAIAGRQLYAGFDGWIISHGLDSKSRERGVSLMLNNPNKRKYFEECGVSYVVEQIGSFEFLKRPSSVVWDWIYEDERFRVWKLKS